MYTIDNTTHKEREDTTMMTIEEYKKEAKKIKRVVITALLFFVGVTAWCIHDAFARGTLYTMRGTVVEVDEASRTTTFVDTEGEMWSFKGIKDWNVTDTIILTVNSRDTEDFHDDEIVGACKG